MRRRQAPPISPERIANALDYVGVLAVEMFVVDRRLLVNELAPRPHNSGHWTLDAARTSQFEQQVRAVCGVGLGDPSMSAPAVAMVNLLGELWADGEPDWSVALADPRASLHLYGKTTPRPGRKMGHITVTAATPDEAQRRAMAIRSRPGGSLVCADHGCRNHHRPHRLAGSDLQPLVVPAGDPRRSPSSTRSSRSFPARRA